MKYGIWSIVKGGVTGHREDWLKHNGDVMLFDSELEADVIANEMTTRRNALNTKATFTYIPRAYCLNVK